MSQKRRGELGVYVHRPLIEDAIREAIEAGQHVVLYGPPGSGKSTLLQHVLENSLRTLIDVHADTKIHDIYRLFILEHGVPIISQAKKTKKGKMSATVNWLVSKIGGEGEITSESTYQHLEVDLKNPVDIGRLLQDVQTKIGVINNAHLLSEGQFQTLAANLNYFFEGTKIQFVICGNWIQRDRLQATYPSLAGKISEILVEGFSRSEFAQYVEQGYRQGPRLSEQVFDFVYQYGEGDASTLVLASELLTKLARAGHPITVESAASALAHMFNGRGRLAYKMLVETITSDRRYRCYAERLEDPKSLKQPAGTRPNTTAKDDEKPRHLEFNLAAWTLLFVVTHATKCEDNPVFEVSSVVAWLEEQLLKGCKPINPQLLFRQLKKLESADRRLNFYRRLFELSEDRLKLTIIDKLFWKYLKELGEDFADQFEEGLGSRPAGPYEIRLTRMITTRGSG